MSTYPSISNKNEEGFISVDGFRLDYIFWPGDDQTVLALHGFGGRAESYSRLAPYLQTHGIGLLSISLPYHGESKRVSAEKLNLETFVPDLVTTLTQLGLHKAPVLAHSFGGRIATAMSVLTPKFTDHIFLMATGGFYPPEDYMFEVLRFLPFRYAMDADWFAGFISGLLIPNLTPEKKEKAIGALRGLIDSYPLISLKKSGILGQLYNYNGKVDIMWGEHDNLVPAKFAYEIRQHFRNAEVQIFKNAGHLLMVEKPDLVAGHILKKLDR